MKPGPVTPGLRAAGLRENCLFNLTQGWMKRAAGYWLRQGGNFSVAGAEGLQGIHQAVFAPTHASHLDFWAVLEGLPPGWAERTYVAAAQDYFYSHPWRRMLMRAAAYHNFAFDRRGSGLEGYRRMVGILRAGFSLLAFPTGSRARDGRIGEFHPLLAMAAVDAGVPLVPVFLSGTRQALPPGQWIPRRHPIAVWFGAPIHATEIGRGSSHSLHSQAREANALVQQGVQALEQKFLRGVHAESEKKI